MKIITISREFGSGGRELGKRIADILGFDYYDKEIISAIAKNKGLNENYVAFALEHHGWHNFPITFRHSFINASFPPVQVDLLLEQKRVIEEISNLGNDFVIIGRNSDILLKEYNPLNLFVCAEMQSKIERCVARADENEHLTVKQMEKKIRSIDKNRARTREMISDIPWGRRDAYHLTLNTSNWDIKELSPLVALFAESWFKKVQ